MVTPTASPGESDWKKMRVQDLRDELASRGLDTTGLKAALIERLEASVPTDVEDGKIAEDEKRDDMDLNSSEGESLIKSDGKQATELTTGVEPPVEAAEVVMTTEAAPVEENVKPSEQIAEVSAAPGESLTSEVTNENAVVPPTDLEKKQRRAERFGLELMVSEVEKRRLRAARFGDTIDGKTNGISKNSSSDEGSKMSPTLKDAEAVKRKARAARFGIEEVRDKTAVPSSEADDARKKARLARFGLEIKLDPQEQEKKKLRAARFGLTPEAKPAVEAEKKIAVEQPVDA